MKSFANRHLGYDRNKGLDFMGKFNNIFVLAEAKFLTDFGEHQNSQFSDAVSTTNALLRETSHQVMIISILDGVLYIPGKNKMYQSITTEFSANQVILSAVLLRDFLYSI